MREARGMFPAGPFRPTEVLCEELRSQGTHWALHNQVGTITLHNRPFVPRAVIALGGVYCS